MSPTNDNDPLRTTDHDPSAAPPAPEITTDLAPASSPVAGSTGAYVPGQDAEPMGAVSERGPETMSVPGYEIESVLGRGGMGVVYKARHLKLKRTVALKMVLAGGHAGPQELARFRIEAEAVARLQHPNIVQIHEVGETAGHPYCALEFVEGGNLAGKIGGKPLPAREAAKLVEALARAMQLAHSRNVVHRDLKPANILLMVDGTPKITDFGLARQLDSDSGETQAGQVMGTPSYMAPEQASGRSHDAGPAADVYALGAILYHCLTGRPPFKGKTVVETLDQVRTQEPVPPSRWQAGVPLDLETICLKCLRKEPEKRYASAAELADELVRYQQGEPILARPVGRIERAIKWVKRNPVVAGAAAVVVLALVGGIIGTSIGLVQADKALQAADRARDGEKAEREKAEGLAEWNAKLAVTERDAKNKAEGLATANAKLADDESKAKNKLEHQLGISDFLLAHAAYDKSDVKLAAERLDKVPEKQRGWEWHYLKQQMHGGLFTLNGPTAHVAFSPDGTRIVTANGNHVKVFDARTGMVLLEQKGFAPPPRGRPDLSHLSVSPDGTRFVTATPGDGKAGGGKLAKVWDAPTGTFLFQTKEHTQLVTCLAFSPGGRRFATGSLREVKVWDADKAGEPLLDVKGFKGRVDCISFSPDGKRIATVSGATVKVWDVEKAGEALFDVKGFPSGQQTVAFSPDGTRLATGSWDGTATVVDARTGTIERVLQLHRGDAQHSRMMPLGAKSGVASVAFSPDGTRIVAGGGVVHEKGEVRVWDVRTGTELLELKGHTQVVMSVAFSPDGTLILSGGADGTVMVSDARTSSGRFDLNQDREDVLSVAFSPDGTRIVTADGLFEGSDRDRRLATRPSVATIWDARTGKALVALKGFKGSVKSVAFSPDGKRIVTGGTVFEKIAEVGGPHPVNVGEATVWDARTGAALLELKGLEEGVNSVAFNRDGTRIVTAAYQDLAFGGTEVKVFDARTGTLLHDLTEPMISHFLFIDKRGGSVSFSRDGTRMLIAGIRDKKRPDGDGAKVCDAQTGAVLVELQGNVGPVLSASFSPDGTRIVTGGWFEADGRGRVKVWDARTGAAVEPFELKGHTGYVNSVSFSPDGTRIVTGSGDRTVKLWDARTGAELLELKGHTGFVMSASFSPDGTRIVSGGCGEGGKPGEVIVWDARTGKEPPDEEELAYRGLHTQPNPWRYREGYLAARAAKDDFAASFYLNLTPPADRTALAARADVEALAPLSDRARAHRNAGELEQALPLFVEIANVTKAKLGPEDPATLEAMTQLGNVHGRMKQFDKSIPVFEEVLKGQEAKLGRGHRATIETIWTLGQSCKNAGRFKEAIPLLEEAQQYGGRDYFVLIEAYARAGENAKLAKFIQKELALARKPLRPDYSGQEQIESMLASLAGRLADVSVPLLQSKGFAEAETLLRESLTIRAKQEPDLWTTFHTKSLLGAALLGQKKYAEAEPQLLAGYEGMKQREKTIGPQGTQIPEAIDRLIELYTRTNKPDEAKKWQTERAKYPPGNAKTPEKK